MKLCSNLLDQTVYKNNNLYIGTFKVLNSNLQNNDNKYMEIPPGRFYFVDFSDKLIKVNSFKINTKIFQLYELNSFKKLTTDFDQIEVFKMFENMLEQSLKKGVNNLLYKYQNQNSVVVLFSGGIDSIAITHILSRLFFYIFNFVEF